MAFLVPASAFGPTRRSQTLSAMGALAGGFAQGMEAKQQLQLKAARAAIAQQEMALRERALQHGLEQERQVQDFSRSLGEFKAWRAGSEDEVQQQGPVQPGAAPLPSQTRWDEVSKRLGDIASKISDARTRDAFLATAQEELQLKELSQHKERIASSISDRIVNNAYSRRVYGGAEDPSGSEAAKALIEQLQRADMSDPQAAAQILDYIEKKDLELRQQTVAHNVRMEQRETMLASVEQQIMAREGAGMPMQEAKALTAAYKGGLVEDADFQRALPDALAGTLSLKMKLAQQEQELKQYQMREIESRIAENRADAMAKSPFGMLLKEGARQAREVAVQKAKGPRLELERTRANGSAQSGTKPLDRAKMIQEEMRNLRGTTEWLDKPDAEVRKQASENVDAMLNGEVQGGGGAAPDVEAEALKKILKSLGVDPEREVKVGG